LRQLQIFVHSSSFVSCLNSVTYQLRASLRSGASITALAPRRTAQSSRFQKTCQPNGGRLMVGGTWPGLIQRLSEKLASLKIR
jgi:hypothetical protein